MGDTREQPITIWSPWLNTQARRIIAASVAVSALALYAGAIVTITILAHGKAANVAHDTHQAGPCNGTAAPITSQPPASDSDSAGERTFDYDGYSDVYQLATGPSKRARGDIP